MKNTIEFDIVSVIQGNVVSKPFGGRLHRCGIRFGNRSTRQERFEQRIIVTILNDASVISNRSPANKNKFRSLNERNLFSYKVRCIFAVKTRLLCESRVEFNISSF